MHYNVPPNTKVISHVACKLLHQVLNLKEPLTTTLSANKNSLLKDFIKEEDFATVKLAQII